MEKLWTSPEFVERAHEWIDARLAEVGQERTGDVEQPHVEEWSTVMRVPVATGTVWFKANHGPLRHEAALTALLATRAPDRVPALLALDAQSGWMLMADAGRRLREVVSEERSLERWHDVLAAYARIQLACEADVPALLELGGARSAVRRPLPGRRTQTCCQASMTFDSRCLPPRTTRPPWGAEPRPRTDCGVGPCSTPTHLHDGHCVFLGSRHPPAARLGRLCVSHPFFTLSVTLEGDRRLRELEARRRCSEDIAPYLE